eukprot:8855415-Lingulodinium_polyedra.AAC.1
MTILPALAGSKVVLCKVASYNEAQASPAARAINTEAASGSIVQIPRGRRTRAPHTQQGKSRTRPPRR